MNEDDYVPSPGGWEAPDGSLAMWDWTPTFGASPRLDRAPLWARIWFHTPFINRYAYAWLWRYGAWDVLPPGMEPDDTD